MAACRSVTHLKEVDGDDDVIIVGASSSSTTPASGASSRMRHTDPNVIVIDSDDDYDEEVQIIEMPQRINNGQASSSSNGPSLSGERKVFRQLIRTGELTACGYRRNC